MRRAPSLLILWALTTLSMTASTTTRADTAPAEGPTSERLTLTRVIELATQAPEVVVAEARIAVAEAQRDGARAQGLPSVGVSAQVSPGGQVTIPLLSQDESALCTAGNLACSVGAAPVGSTRASTGADLRWRVFDFGATAAGVDARQQGLEATRVRSKAAALGAMGRAVKLFLAVIADDELVRVREGLANDRRRQADVVKARAAAGDVPPSDVLQAEVAAEAAAYDVELARTQARVDRIALSGSLGLAGHGAGDVVVDGSLDLALEGAVALDPTSHPDVRAAVLEQQSARAGADQAALGHLPTFDATASVNAAVVAITKPDANLTPSAGVGLSMAWPVLNFGIDADARQAEANRLVADKTVRANLVAVETAQQQAKAWLAAQEGLVIRATRLRESARNAVDVVVGRMEAGAGRLPELLDAQASLAAAEATLVQARANRAAAVVDLAVARGAIDAGTFVGG